MERRNFIAAGIASLVIARAPASVAVEPWVQDVNSYLSSVKSAFGPFSQVDANGAKASGRFFMLKPGKMRFEYDQKDYPMMVADGSFIAIFDPKSNSGSQTYPQTQSPLSLLSRNDINLMDSRFVRKLTKKGNEALITMSDPDHPNYGSLVVRVAISNPRILGWQSIDQKGGKTTVTMQEFHTDLAMNPDLFNIVKVKNSR